MSTMAPTLLLDLGWLGRLQVVVMSRSYAATVNRTEFERSCRTAEVGRARRSSRLPWRVAEVHVVPIAGERPESGVRITIERDRAEVAPPWRYTGAAHVPDASFPLVVVVEASGDVKVELSPTPVPPPDLAERVRLIVRAAHRQAKADDEPPAWRIVRWRGEK